MASTVVVQRAPQSRKGGCQAAGAPRASSGRKWTDGHRLDATPTRPQPGPPCPRPGATGLEGSGRSTRPNRTQRGLTSSPIHRQETRLSSEAFWSWTQCLRPGDAFLPPIEHPLSACVAAGVQAGGGLGASRPSPQGWTPAPEPGPVRNFSFFFLVVK